MTWNMIDSIMNKCKTHKPLTIDEYEKLGTVMDILYGDLTDKDIEDEGITIKYPINLIYAVFGFPKDICVSDQAAIKEIEENIEYVLNNTMTPEEAGIIRMRFRGEMSLEDVGKTFGKTRERIRQLELKALRKLRHPSRSKAIFTPFKLTQEIKERTEVLNQKNKELADNITQCLNQIDILSKALEGVGIKVTTEKPISYAVTLARNIDEFDFSVRAYNCMKRAGINTIGDLTERTEEEMKKVRNLGGRGLQEIKEKMTSLGVRFMSEEERKQHPIHTRDEIKNGCVMCEHCYHDVCRSEFKWDEECENHCANYKLDKLFAGQD